MDVRESFNIAPHPIKIMDKEIRNGLTDDQTGCCEYTADSYA